MSRRRPPNATLMDKFKDHYNNRREFASTRTRNYSNGAIVTAFLIFSFFIEAPIVLLPSLYSAQEENNGVVVTVARSGWFGEGYWVALLVIVFSLGEVLWNWWRSYFDVPNWVTKETKAAYFPEMVETPPGWKHCPTCKLDAPPRSHHCKICKRCILKRDHHCYFTGSCVGFFNQRHFVMFCVYAIWSLLMGIYFQVSYISLEVPLSENYITYLPFVSFFQFLLGNLSFGRLLLMGHAYLNLMFVAVTTGILSVQLVVIVKGQTSYEVSKSITYYRRGLHSNITSVFGSPLLSWLLLFAPLMLPLDGDGVRWVVTPKPEKGR